MNKKGNLQMFGAVLFIIGALVLLLYALLIYLPAITTNPADADALLNAFFWGIGCAVLMIIGAFFAKGR